MSDKLSAAIEELQLQLQAELQRAAETKKTINALCRRMGKPALYEDVDIESSASWTGQIKPDQFYGKGLHTAAREYLEMRRSACEAGDVLRGMEQGGFDFKSMDWKDEKSRLRNLAINLAKNTAVFHRLPNGTFGLLSWYPEVMNRKSERRAQENGVETTEETEQKT
jgi:hypothetical protein